MPLPLRAADMTSRFAQSWGVTGPRAIHYREWGQGSTLQQLICVHGMGRTSRDFDSFAEAAASRFHILCPDLSGMGKSDWLRSTENYEREGWNLHLNDLRAIIAQSGASKVDYVGTSLGGVLGIKLAAQKDSPIRRLVLNDVAPFVPKKAVSSFYRALASDLKFRSLLDVEKFVRLAFREVGPLDDAGWKKYAEDSIWQSDCGSYRLACDPTLFLKSEAQSFDLDLWTELERISCPTLIIRGAHSQLLSRDMVTRMLELVPGSIAIEMPNCGHAPHLRTQEQYEPVLKWLLNNQGDTN